jgi:arabinose-5-phosphate isomerase
VLPLPSLPEAGSPHGAPTTSTTMMLVLGDALAMELMARKGLDADEFGVLHPAGALGAALNNRRA